MGAASTRELAAPAQGERVAPARPGPAPRACGLISSGRCKGVADVATGVRPGARPTDWLAELPLLRLRDWLAEALQHSYSEHMVIVLGQPLLDLEGLQS